MAYVFWEHLRSASCLPKPEGMGSSHIHVMDGLRLPARVRARLGDGERGFTLIETVVAITVIFGSLSALAYTATAGFGYQDAARQRQTANAVASQLMEKVRGLSTAQITAGLLSTDLTGDSCINNAVSPPLFAPAASGCNLGSTFGSGEKIVSGPSQSVFPLKTHLWCTSATQTIIINHISYSCGTYVTQDLVTNQPWNQPYRITVVVTWSGGARGPNKIVQIQSLFWAAPGCASSTTHPYAGPCEPFFTLQAVEPAVDIGITAASVSPAGTTFVSGDLFAPGATATEQTEQASILGATTSTAGVSMTGPVGTTTSVGKSTVPASADDNPGTSTGTDNRVPCGSTCTVPSSPSLSSGANSISMTAPDTTGESDSTTTAGASGTLTVCPPFGSADADAFPCAGATGAAGSSTSPLLAAVTLGGTTPALGGPITIAKVIGPMTSSVYVDRQFASGYGCTSPSPTVGCVGASATRSLGTITIGDLPSAANWSVRPASWAGFIKLSGYSDSLSAAVGSGASVGVPTMGGTLQCWNGSSYTAAVSLTDTSLNSLSTLCSYSNQTGSGPNKVTITMNVTSSTAGSVSPASTVGVQTLGSALAQVVTPTVTVHYQIIFGNNSADNVNLTITVNLGAPKIQGTYTAAPTGP